MTGLDIIKETVECEQLVDQFESDSTIRGEYLIPDTHPDVVEIVQVGTRTVVTNREVQQERILVEGKVNFDINYLAKEEEGLGVHSVTFSDKFSQYIDINGANNRMMCDAEYQIEHIEYNIINERKISLESLAKINCDLYDSDEFDYVKEIEGFNDIQIKRKTDSFDKIIYKKKFDMVGKCKLQVPTDKNEIGKIIKCNATLHNKEIKVLDGKIEISCSCKFELVYRDLNSRDINILEEDIQISTEDNVSEINSDMIPIISFRKNNINYVLDKDDLGEDRIVNVETFIDADIKIISQEHIDFIEDAYSPSRNMELKKENKNLNLFIEKGTGDCIVKDNIEIDAQKGLPVQVINTSGKILKVNKKIIDGKVMLDGIVKVEVLYKTSDEFYNIAKTNGEIPFSILVDTPKARGEMKSVIKSWIETLQANIEANTIAIKAIIISSVYLFQTLKKIYISSIEEKEGELPNKRASLTIYVVQKDDNLWELAKRYNSTIKELLLINDFETPEDICIGEKIIIPGRISL